MAVGPVAAHTQAHCYFFNSEEVSSVSILPHCGPVRLSEWQIKDFYIAFSRRGRRRFLLQQFDRCCRLR